MLAFTTAALLRFQGVCAQGPVSQYGRRNYVIKYDYLNFQVDSKKNINMEYYIYCTKALRYDIKRVLALFFRNKLLCNGSNVWHVKTRKVVSRGIDICSKAVQRRDTIIKLLLVTLTVWWGDDRDLRHV